MKFKLKIQKKKPRLFYFDVCILFRKLRTSILGKMLRLSLKPPPIHILCKFLSAQLATLHTACLLLMD